MSKRHTTRWTVSRWIVAACAGLGAWTTLQAQDSPPPIPRPNVEDAPQYSVGRVVDEQTVRVRGAEGERTLALCGLRSPATEAGRERLRRFLVNLLKGEAVVVQSGHTPDADAREAQLAHLFRVPDGLFVNLEAVRQGYAKVASPPEFKHRQLFQYYEQVARTAEKGVWAPRPPSEQERAAAQPTEPTAQGGDDIIVYVTKSGKKYHRKGCQYLRKSSRPIKLKEAVRRGYEPCSRCKPPTLKNP